MQQVKPIEEVLAEFRQKYKTNGTDRVISPVPPADEPSVDFDIRAKQTDKRHASFSKIVFSQAAAAALIAAAVFAVKLFNPQMYDYIYGIIVKIV
jgi:hypothetical protein